MFMRLPLPEGPFDLTVIGGGLTGAAIARDAVLRGLSVCLLDRGDFAGGSTGRTPGMVQGGLRYLEQLRPGLVWKLLRERAILLARAPHLVAPVPFLIPIYRGRGRGNHRIRAELILQDCLALGRRIAPSRMLPPEEVIARAPGIQERDLIGGGLQFDCILDDARLCLANILDARAAGGDRFQFRNYARVVEQRPTSPISIRVEDRVLRRELTVQSHRVVRAVGAWTDFEGASRPLLEPTRGAHIVLPSRSELLGGEPEAGEHGLLPGHSREGKILFILPWMGRTLVGATETPFRGNPEGAAVEPGEILELASGFQRAFPSSRIGPSQVLAVFAGVRLAAPGIFRLRPSWDRRIQDDGHGTLTVAGGLHATSRSGAEKVVNRILPGTSSPTARRPLPGGELGPWSSYRAGEGSSWIERFGEETVRALFSRHGSNLRDVLELAGKDPGLAEPIAPGILRAEVRHAVQRESVVYPEDFLARRTTLRFGAGGGRELYDLVEGEISASHPPPDLDAARERYLADLDEEERIRKVLAAPH